MIVSVSRRCDIPRFQFDWFMGRLNDGFAEAVNPFNAHQKKRVSLRPEDVDLFVFWTRDPRKILENAEELICRGFSFYVMVTVIGYPPSLEPSMVQTSKVLAAMRELADKIGAERVIWRYDPVILTSITDKTFHCANFDALAQKLSGCVQRVIISLYDEYRGAKQRLAGLEGLGELTMLDTGTDLADMLTAMAKSAKDAGMEIQSCAEKEDFSPFGIKPGACIDAALVERICGREVGGKDKNQRPNCLCCKSVDIGAYGICGAHCVYCYAW
jgi:hypothetical protein